MSEVAKIGIVTVSDRASRGEYEDRGGPAIVDYFNDVLTSPWEAVAEVIPDERETVAAILTRLADEENCCLIVTTGGTGPAVRDITPEATEAVCEKMMPGFGELMRLESLKAVPTAILVETNGRDTWSVLDCKSSRPAKSDPGMHGRCHAGDPVLHRSY